MKQFKVSDIGSLANYCRSMGYKFFDRGAYNLNVFGIRSTGSVSDQFDDALLVIYRGYKGDWVLEQFECTTDPGKHWLLNPLNVMGTIITVPGQYLKSHKLGYHNKSKGPDKRYRALEQCNPMVYVRDNNRDNELDFSLIQNKSNHFSGIMYTNIHRASKWQKTLSVGAYSAGCTVLNEGKDLLRLIELVEIQRESGFGEYISYTLIDEKCLK